jgi:hypothetical protein
MKFIQKRNKNKTFIFKISVLHKITAEQTRVSSSFLPPYAQLRVVMPPP